ncbi:uncharacterized protein LOC126418450 [Schistocerca serialis cubense]|uniref:uncharacterized protein LOC126418450 n=1 Tax=Schistocerca serialis cubense TaxID=2023355 RepID=UPI00214E6CC8|nr:uncharacterized protein LOC126418450 [Schistocerca serialis cubense]
MRRPQKQVPGTAPLAVLLAAAGCVALAAAEPPRLQDVCSRQQGNVSCTCSQQHPEIDVVSNDTGFLSGAYMITIENCSVVKLGAHTLEKAAGLQKLRVLNVSHLELESILPKSLRELVLSGIGELASIPVAIFQEIENMETLITQDVAFKELESHFLNGITLNYTEIAGCRFPNLSSDSLYIESLQVVVKSNKFASLGARAVTVQSEDATVSDNTFAVLASDSIRWHHWSQGGKSRLSFQRNTIQALETGALSGLRASESSTSISDNVLLCLAEEYERCRELAVSDDLRVCDVEDVCPYRKRTGVTEALAEARGCAAGSPLSAEQCAVLAVGNKPSGAACLHAPSSVVGVAAAIALLATTWFTV